MLGTHRARIRSRRCGSLCDRRYEECIDAEEDPRARRHDIARLCTFGLHRFDLDDTSPPTHLMNSKINLGNRLDRTASKIYNGAYNGVYNATDSRRV